LLVYGREEWDRGSVDIGGCRELVLEDVIEEHWIIRLIEMISVWQTDPISETHEVNPLTTTLDIPSLLA
jgi:hypothetical protein